MQAVQVSAIAALVMLTGHAAAQTTPIAPTYYPQCWFWQLPDNAAFLRGDNSLSQLERRFVPALNAVLGGSRQGEATAACA